MTDRKVRPAWAMGLAVSLVASGAAVAQAVKAPPGFVDDTRGNVVVDSAGECVKTTRASPGAPCPEVAKKVEVAPAGPEKLTLSGTTLFDFNKATLRPEGRRELSGAIEQVKRKLDGYALEQRQISITGHTDSVGSDQYNQKLSEARARTVAEFMVENGVDPRIIRARGMGESQPVADNATAEGRQRNRRVEIEYRALAQPKS